MNKKPITDTSDNAMSENESLASFPENKSQVSLPVSSQDSVPTEAITLASEHVKKLPGKLHPDVKPVVRKKAEPHKTEKLAKKIAENFDGETIKNEKTEAKKLNRSELGRKRLR